MSSIFDSIQEEERSRALVLDLINQALQNMTLVELEQVLGRLVIAGYLPDK